MANKKFYYKKRKPAAPNIEAEQKQVAKYSEKQLMTPIEALGLSESTLALLQKNRIKIASDLVKRTEKDMYKIQGLNKKILIEVKNALKKLGMSIREEEQAPAANATPKQLQKPADDKKEKKSRFGLADRDEKPEQKPTQEPKKADKPKAEKPEKLIAILLFSNG